jgi:sodium pump decarboxylase gamma subunit
MKRIISLTLAALMLVTLLLTATSCGMESITGYTQLRDHLIDTVGENQAQPLDAQAVKLNSASVCVVPTGDGKREVHAVAYAVTQGRVFQVTLQMNGSVEKALLVYEVLDASTADVKYAAYATVLLTHYTGNDLVEFVETDNIAPGNEPIERENATTLLNSLFIALDTYTTKELGMNLHDLGFIVLSDKYMAPVEEAETEEDLGGAFSSARLSKAGLMILQGIGMVFLVLAILWLVLLIFKKVFYKDPAKEEKKSKPAKTEAPASASAPVVEAPVAVAPVADDGALIAAITAAVSAYIESDPALTSQFAGGFRVVSFKPTTKSRNR